MPINCPLGEEMVCEDCRYRYHWANTTMCNWFFPAIPIREILTLDERITRLEKDGVKIEHRHFHSNLSKKEWNEMEQTKRRSLFALSEIKELQDKRKVDKQGKYTKYK